MALSARNGVGAPSGAESQAPAPGGFRPRGPSGVVVGASGGRTIAERKNAGWPERAHGQQRTRNRETKSATAFLRAHPTTKREGMAQGDARAPKRTDGAPFIY